MHDERSGARRADDRELEEQLVVFAREVGELYAAERVRTRELERALDDLRETYLATMRSLATVVEAKDVVALGEFISSRVHRLPDVQKTTTNVVVD